MYKRITVYPNGEPIPEVLPDSYQPVYYGNAPTGQSCLSCAHFNPINRYCSKWQAPVRPRWWCEGWTQKLRVSRSNTRSQLLKKITTSTVEEHFSESTRLKPTQLDYDFFTDYTNEVDVIKLNVPLMIRLLEWAREDASKDVELHVIAERLIELSDEGDTLTMSDYPEIVVQETEVEKKEK